MENTAEIYWQTYEHRGKFSAAEKRKAKIVGSLILSVLTVASIKAATYKAEVQSTTSKPLAIEKAEEAIKHQKLKKFNPKLGRLMSAIARLESNNNYKAVNEQSGAEGKYQIMPANWPSWSRERFGKVVPKTPQNQEKIAKQKLGQYLDELGSSKLAAVAWFAGPQAAQNLKEGDKTVLRRSDGNMTVKEYVETVQNNIAEQKTSALEVD